MTRILIVEDDSLLLRMYQKKLEKDGYEVITAVDGEAGVQSASENKPDMILLDILLPKKSGFEVLEELKSDNETKDIPVVILSNLGNSEADIERGLELGAVAYLIKSQVVPSDVVAKVKEVLSATKKDDLPKAVST